MELKVIHSTANCADSSCPTIYINEAGNYVIQGFKIKATDKSKVNVPKGEDMIEVPAEFLQQFIEKMK
ncbi:MAG: hypothetical protein R3B93_19010 [Bacteroidia bacterium]